MGAAEPVRCHVWIRLSGGIGVDDGDDLVTRGFGVRAPLEDERHRGVAVRSVAARPEGVRRALVRGLAAHVDSTGDDGVEFAATQCARGDAQRGDPGEFLAGDGEAEPAEVTLGVDAVGRDIRHGSDDAVGGQSRGGLGVSGKPAIIVGVLHPQPLARDGGVAPHADDHPGAVRVGADIGKCLARCGQHRRLLGEAGLEFHGRKAQSGEFEFHCVQRVWVCRRAECAPTERPRVARIAGDHTHAADDDVADGRRPPRRRAARRLVVRHDQVGVVPAEAEVADRRAFDRAVPRCGGGRDGEGCLRERGSRVVAQRRWGHRRLHRREHIDQAGRAGDGDGVSQIALERAQPQRHLAVGGDDALKFGRIPE